MTTKALVTLIFANIWYFTNANWLPVCNTETNLTERRLCKITSTYPVLPLTIQPIVTILELLDLDTTDNSMTVSLQTRLTWNDTGATAEGPKTRMSDWIKVDGRSQSEFFWPRITFENQRSNKKLDLFGDMESSYQYFWFLIPHWVEYAEFHSITVGCLMSSSHFPFDSHTCSLTFYAPDNSNSTLIFLPVIIEGSNVVDERVNGHSLPFNVTIKTLEPYVVNLFGYNYNVAGLNFTFQRNNALALITGYFIPSGLYSLLSTLSFLVPKDQLAGRMGMLLTLFLISTNAYNAVEGPEHRGVSFIEIWMVGTHIPIMIAILEYGCVLGINKIKDKSLDFKKCDTGSLALTTIYHAVFHFTYWLSVSKYI